MRKRWSAALRGADRCDIKAHHLKDDKYKRAENASSGGKMTDVGHLPVSGGPGALAKVSPRATYLHTEGETSMSQAPATTARPQFESLQSGAERLGVSVKTFRSYVSQGLIPAYRLGAKTVRVRCDDVDAMARRIPTAAASQD